jgi:hypothetical protein
VAEAGPAGILGQHPEGVAADMDEAFVISALEIEIGYIAEALV